MYCSEHLLKKVDLSLFIRLDSNEKVTDIESEVEKFNDAIEASKIELTKIRNNAEAQLGADK
ncbi:hypothetical protein D9V09_06710, partial [Staphylococcus epidermidis]